MTSRPRNSQRPNETHTDDSADSSISSGRWLGTGSSIEVQKRSGKGISLTGATQRDRGPHPGGRVSVVVTPVTVIVALMDC
jgi:hypothetical protein